MDPHEKQIAQIKTWLTLAADLTEKISKKKESDISKRDIIKIAQKIEDIVNVLYGKSKIYGWRSNDIL